MQASHVSTRRQPWLYGPVVDLLVGCGGWSIPLLFLVYLATRATMGSVVMGFYVLAALCNNPHYMATLQRAHATPADSARYAWVTVGLGSFLLLVGLIAHWTPQMLPVLFTVYFVWSPWHYSGQNFGIT